MHFLLEILEKSWDLLLDSSVYVLFGLVISGLVRAWVNPQTVARHLGQGRFTSVFKAALVGAPLPLCSCGVLPAAASLKKQGANNGAATAFLIATPETGIDSIALSSALLDPILTVFRPLAALVTAIAAGLGENLFQGSDRKEPTPADLRCPVDGCCDGLDCHPEDHRRHHSHLEKIRMGVRHAFGEVWNDIAGWFFLGLLLAGLITALVPETLFRDYLGAGFTPLLVMLAFSIPLYVCASASTPIAAALILKGISPGAALVFLLAGPATNVTSLTVLTGLLGKRATAFYLGAIALFSIFFGLLVDSLYPLLGISPRAVMGQAGELIPEWAQGAGAVLLLTLSIKPLVGKIRLMTRRVKPVPIEASSGQGRAQGPAVLPSCSEKT
ncbi:MAG: SO_0444 family Cu/Zn efflux transporter [Deltaproteobacteria bacterium]|nr:SO_0444 family Cu/Zn efflux transporter [Deltaproteobacteria bacterium]